MFELEILSNAVTAAWEKSLIERQLQPRGQAWYPLEVTTKTEPRIEYLSRLLGLLVQHGTFLKEGRSIAIDGFVLKDLAHWTVTSDRLPDELFSILSRPCNARCEFCYVRGNPPDSCIQFNSMSTTDNQAEIELRLKLFQEGKRLFNPTFDREEIITNPFFLDVLKQLRPHTNRVFTVNTNGFTLRPWLLDRLARFEPIEISVSLNAVGHNTRERLMGDGRHTVLEALRELQARKMRFHITVVPWPTLAWEELEETIHFAARCNPHAIYAILPGHTRFFSESPLFELEDFWSESVSRLVELRGEINVPLIIQPRLYEESLTRRQLNLPVIIGVTPESAGARAGVRVEDIVREVNGTSIVSRRQAENLILLLRNARAKEIPIVVERNGQWVAKVLRPEEAYAQGYNYPPPYTDCCGIHFISQGIGIGDIKTLFKIAEHHRARRVAVSTSWIVLPSFVDCLRRWGHIVSDYDCEIIPFVPENHYYGGNICLGDLLTVGDFRSSIHELVRKGLSPDLIVVPTSAFNVGGWWRDLRGVPFAHIQHATSIPVVPLVAEVFE